MALAMLATAILQEALRDLLRATAACPWPARSRPPARANFSRTTAASSGSSPRGPNTFGKYAGWILPSITLQSVTASGPPRR